MFVFSGEFPYYSGHNNSAELQQRRCTEEGCNNFAPHGGLCDLCHAKVRKRELVTGKMPLEETCLVEGCGKKATGAGYCNKDFRIWRQLGRPEGWTGERPDVSEENE